MRVEKLNSKSRLPEGFSEFYGENIMSNFDGRVVKETEDAIKGKNLCSKYPGCNFHGTVWWQEGKWLCEVSCYGGWRETVICDTTEAMIEEISSKYGHE